jgi:putative polyhydroxyalkanoate system protein
VTDLHIVREHALGLARARKIAFKWAEEVETEFGMQCTYSEGKTVDEVDFVRTGVKGTLKVSKDRFELSAHLGFLVGAFKGKIEAEIVKNLDTLLVSSEAARTVASTPATQPRQARKT